jgi:hypothetical protein
MLWSDDTPGNVEIYYKRSMDGGTTWTAFPASDPRFTMTSGDSWCPDIAVDSSDNLHIVWDDDTLGNQEIYYKKGKW